MRGIVVAIPVLNTPGFLRHQRGQAIVQTQLIFLCVKCIYLQGFMMDKIWTGCFQVTNRVLFQRACVSELTGLILVLLREPQWGLWLAVCSFDSEQNFEVIWLPCAYRCIPIYLNIEYLNHKPPLSWTCTRLLLGVSTACMWELTWTI